MNQRTHRQIHQMEWATFEEQLRPATRGRKRAVAETQALREYFGDEEFEYLQNLAEHAQQVRSRAPILGNVVFLPGIMGSDLTVDDDGDADVVWVNLFRLARGRFEQLRLTADGSGQAHRDLKVFPSEVDKRTYARMILWLRARWNVEPFAYDWRKDIDTASNELARFIRQKFPSQPVHVVAHSMGGLVSRNFIRLHADLWHAMADGNGKRGGQLIMLGTPNYGSYAIPKALTGSDKLVRWLAALDLSHDLDEVIEVLNTFVGSYLMLPAPGKVPAATQTLYRRESWGSFPVSDQHLKRAMEFHYAMENAAIDPDRMVYIAGCNQETLSAIRLVSPGEFDYDMTYDGDGRVTHELGLLKDVLTYYVDEVHGDLPKHEDVMKAVDELLERGVTSALPLKPVADRAIRVAGRPFQRGIEERAISGKLRLIAERAQRDEATPAEVREAEEMIMQGALEQDPSNRTPTVAKDSPAPEPSRERVHLTIEVLLGDVTEVQSPVIVVGHYQGIAPVRAEGAIDATLDYWISKAEEHGMIGAELGQLFFIPVAGGKMRTSAVVLAGMGESGHFSREDLRFLITNVALAISALGHNKFATVLIGSGQGNLSRERALRGMLDGLCDALSRLPKSGKATPAFRILLVEKDKQVHKEIAGILHQFSQDTYASYLALQVVDGKLRPAKKGRRIQQARPQELAPEPLPGARMTIEHDKDTFRFSALTKIAVVPVRDVKVQSFFAQGAAERLMQSRTKAEQERYGRLLHTYLIPEDFQSLLDSDDPLTLILDRSTASFPWEMACYRSPRRTVFFGPDLKLTRQFRTLLSSAPGVAPPLNRNLKILVIADPAPEPALHLPGARQEGREVVAALRRIKKETGFNIEVIDRIGPTECDPIEVLALILNEEFDIVHFAGHGVFNQDNPAAGGWVFGKDRILSARDIFRLRRVPRLVFANACFSAVTRGGLPLTADEMNRDLAGLAEAFFERGIHNYIGAGWPVDDGPAVAFAKTFYTEALQGETLGESLAAARQIILHQGSTWGAYQHYGQVNARVVVEP